MGAPLEVPDLSPVEWEEDAVSVWIEHVERRSRVVRNCRRGGGGNQ